MCTIYIYVCTIFTCTCTCIQCTMMYVHVQTKHVVKYYRLVYKKNVFQCTKIIICTNVHPKLWRIMKQKEEKVKWVICICEIIDHQ